MEHYDFSECQKSFLVGEQIAVVAEGRTVKLRVRDFAGAEICSVFVRGRD